MVLSTPVRDKWSVMLVSILEGTWKGPTKGMMDYLGESQSITGETLVVNHLVVNRYWRTSA